MDNSSEVGIGRSWLLGCTVVACIFAATWLLNRYIFPSFLSVLSLAREAASVGSVCGYAFVAVSAMRRPRVFLYGRCTALALMAHACGFLGMAASLDSSSGFLLSASSFVMNAGRAVVSCMAMLVVADLGKRAAASCIACGIAASYALRPVLLGVGMEVSVALFACAPFALALISRTHVARYCSAMTSAPLALEVSFLEPRSFLPFSHVLFVSFFVFRAAHGCSLTLNASDGMPLPVMFPLLPLAAAALYASCARVRPSSDILYQVAFLLVVAGLIGTFAPGSDSSSLPNALLAAGSDCFNVMALYTLCVVGARNPLNALAVLAWGQCALSGGVLLGTSIGNGVAFLSTAAPDAVFLLMAFVLFVFVAFNATALRMFSFEAVIDGVSPYVSPGVRVGGRESSSPGEGDGSESFSASDRPSPSAAAPVGDRRLCAPCPVSDHACSPRGDGDSLVAARVDAAYGRVARDFGLTEREAEIMSLLARGRNVPFIEEELIISRNTIKTHVKHIYQKLDVHSQQELIDLVEAHS